MGINPLYLIDFHEIAFSPDLLFMGHFFSLCNIAVSMFHEYLVKTLVYQYFKETVDLQMIKIMFSLENEIFVVG